ncbi:MAG: sugar transferase [Erysipelotrichaceae bacterium]|nr:sugar transferase [Erysipelotrichaceae bacterium]
MYKNCFKRVFDFILSLTALIILSPIFLILIIIGTVQMQGNPFFTQERPGRDEKIFKLIKFRSMSNRKDKEGNLLPDEERITNYGEFIRKTSLDELPELFNILKGDMAIVGPRPLLVKYLPYYTEEERLRHSVRPGLTGLAQINGRNNLDWDPRLALDVQYVKNLSLVNDIRILIATVFKVFRREDVATIGNFKVLDLDEARKNQNG